MDRPVYQSVNQGRPSADGAVFSFANAHDEPDIRRLLSECPTDGWIRLTLEREPDALAAATVMGPLHDVLLVRDRQSGELLAMGEWSARSAFVNREPRLVPYLSSLRVTGRGRFHPAWARTAFERIFQLQSRQDALPFALTAIAADNHAALRMLGSNRSGMPIYRPLEPFSTFALMPHDIGRQHLDVEKATEIDIPLIAAHLQRTYQERQFAPIWSGDDLIDSEQCRGLRPSDFLLVRRGSNIVGCLALWDQHSFKQTRVQGYAPWLTRVRPAINLFASSLRIPSLPANGTLLRQVFFSHLAVAQDDPEVFSALLNRGLSEAHRRGFAVALIGLALRHPLATVLRRKYRCFEYKTLLHSVYYEEGRSGADALLPSLPHVEIAVL